MMIPVYEDAKMDPITLYAKINNMSPFPSLKITIETTKKKHENFPFLPLIHSVLTLIRGVQTFDIVTRGSPGTGEPTG